MKDWIQLARDLGFDRAVPLEPSRLQAREDIRAMCRDNRCGAYNRNWTCPPAVGTVAECQARMKSYEKGILLQTIGKLSKIIDRKAYIETEQRHLEQFRAFAEEIRQTYPDALCLGSGGCRICKTCAYPDPCRHPEKALSSMEAYGLFVTQVCRDNDLPYYYGEKTIAYTACVLYEKKQAEDFF